jgi:hypothetical protein
MWLGGYSILKLSPKLLVCWWLPIICALCRFEIELVDENKHGDYIDNNASHCAAWIAGLLLQIQEG